MLSRTRKAFCLALSLAVLVVCAGTLQAGERKLFMDKFKLGVISYGDSTVANYISTAGVSATPLADPIELWEGFARVKLPVGHAITGVSFWTGGALAGQMNRARLYRVQFGAEPELLASADYTVPVGGEGLTKVDLTFEPGAELVVERGYKYYMVLTVDVLTFLRGASVTYQ